MKNKSDKFFQIILSNNQKLGHPYGIAIFNDIIFWSEFRNSSIHRVDLKNRNQIETIFVDNSPLFELLIFDSSIQNGIRFISFYFIELAKF